MSNSGLRGGPAQLRDSTDKSGDSAVQPAHTPSTNSASKGSHQ